ncbi:hypothetical protein [Spiroplasma helicoides]|nr:hypothetical protein [Spiroplasma helicoides]
MDKPILWSTVEQGFLNWFTFYLGHACILFGGAYLYLYGFTGYKFGKQAIFKAMITGAMVILGVETWNRFFGTNYIIGDITGALGIEDMPRLYVLILIFTVGNIYIALGLSFVYFFKPIYERNNDNQLHKTWCQISFTFLKTKFNKSKNVKINKKDE